MRFDDSIEAFREYRRTSDRKLRNCLFEQHLHLVEPHVRGLCGRGVAAEDLRQVGLLAMFRALDRFDPDRGASFSTFADRTIRGALKRELRDRSWSVRPPRRQQELYLELRRVEEELVQRNGRSPTVFELAGATGEPECRVIEALEAGAARNATSLDQPISVSGTSTPMDRMGGNDDRLANLEIRVLVRHLLDTLGDREREVMALRFFEDLGQPEIADRLGLSQSYVSRLISRILRSLHERLLAYDTGAMDDLAAAS